MVVGSQTPRVQSVPDSASNKAKAAFEIATTCGLNLDPWQRLVIEGATGVRSDGKWAAFEVGVNVPRQNGKGGILEARELAGLFEWGERLILHSAHQFDTSMEAFLRMEELIEEGGLQKLLKDKGGVSRSHGSEGFVTKDGGRLRYRTRTKGGGRGFTGDTLMLDECMVLAEAFLAALLPTVSGRTISGNPQVWYTGSAVDQFVHEHGTVFARLRNRGLAGDDPALAYFEWSADEELGPDEVTDELSGDEEAWAAANPGLGIRIASEHVQRERRSLDARAFAVERLGIGDWPIVDGSDSIIDMEQWAALEQQGSVIVSELCLAFDVTPARSFTTIAAAGFNAEGNMHVEVIDRRRGTGWVVDRLRALRENHRPVSILCDGASPASSLVHEIEVELGVEVQTLTAQELGKGCGLLVDLVEQQKLRHLGTPELRVAVQGATTRPLGDAWAWSRKTSKVDISPLVACTEAAWGAATVNSAKPFALAW